MIAARIMGAAVRTSVASQIASWTPLVAWYVCPVELVISERGATG